MPGLCAYSDSSFAGEQDARSRAGYIIFYYGTPFCWYSKVIPGVSNSTGEAEYKILAITARELRYYRRLLETAELPVEETITIYCDSTAAIAIAQADKLSKRARTFEVSYHTIKEEVREKRINVEYVDTRHMLADVMTKPLRADLQREFLTQVMWGFKE